MRNKKRKIGPRPRGAPASSALRDLGPPSGGGHPGLAPAPDRGARRHRRATAAVCQGALRAEGRRLEPLEGREAAL